MERVNVAFGYMRAHIAQYVAAIENEIKKVKRMKIEEETTNIYSLQIYMRIYTYS